MRKVDGYCVSMKQPSDWPGEWTKQIGRAVARHRKMKGLSAAALSAKTAEHGFPIPRNTITNLENGRKEGIPVHEVTVIAQALKISALDLLFPMVEEDGSLSSDYVARLASARPFTPHGLSEFHAFRSHHDAVTDLLQEAGRKDAIPEVIARIAERLAKQRDRMADRGLPLPALADAVSEWLEVGEDGVARYTVVRREEEGRLYDALRGGRARIEAGEATNG